MSRNYEPTSKELQRMGRGEENYSDDEWLICPYCNGSGMERDGKLCVECGGEGEVLKDRMEKINDKAD